MFTGFMVNAWIVGTIVAIIAGLVGFFVVLRGSAFVAHAIPNGSFAGAAGAALIGINTLIGLGAFACLGALAIGSLSRRGRQDAITALTLTLMLGLGALFLSMSTEYAPELYSLLFGEILGISTTELVPTLAIAGGCAIALGVLARPLLLATALPDLAEARGINTHGVQLAFLIVVAAATTMTVPVVGTLLIFALMIGPPAAARSLTSRPSVAIALAVALALATVWAAIALSYTTDYPIGFYVGTASAALYAVARVASRLPVRRASVRAGRPAPVES